MQHAMMQDKSKTDDVDEIAIQITDLHKYYPIFSSARRRVRYLNTAIFKGIEAAMDSADKVRAINGLSLTVRRGERVGIIGRNGAGKSTLLKLLAGGFKPNKGSIDINGDIYSLMPGNVSFSPEMSAYENSRNYLAQFGFDERTVMQKVQEIEEFVELGTYFHRPIKSYSLGMRVRTEFAAATCLDAEILMIDEVLGAGDAYWTIKCAKRMETLCLQGRTLLFVSHALDQVMKFCDRCIWIDQGNVVMQGSSFEVSRRYEGFLERLSWHTGDVDDKQAILEEIVPNLGNVTLPASGQDVVRWPGIGSIEFSGIWVQDQGLTKYTARQSEDLILTFQLSSTVAAAMSLRILVTFWGSDGKRVATLENDRLQIDAQVGSLHELRVTMNKNQLGVGDYTLSFSLFSLGEEESTANEQSARQDVVYKSISLTIEPSELFSPSFPADHKFMIRFDDHAQLAPRG